MTDRPVLMIVGFRGLGRRSHIGARGQSAAVTLVERTTTFLRLLALPEGKGSASVTYTVIEHVAGLPEIMCGSSTWDQGTEMARHAALTLATSMPVFFRSPSEPVGAGHERERQTVWFASTSRKGPRSWGISRI